MAVCMIIVVLLGWFISYYFRNENILWFASIFALGMNVVSYWYSDKITMSLAGAKPTTREQYPDFYRAVENLVITAGLPMPALFVVDDPAPNAFATGRDKQHAAIAVTSGLLAMMNKDELAGVLAHELSHIGNRDTLLQTVVVVLVGFIAILSNFFLRTTMFGGGRNRDSREGGNQIEAILAVVGIIFVVLSPIIAQLIQLAISRKREFLADASGALLTRYPEGLASALEKIEAYGGQIRNANNATAHLYIANPFGAKAKKGIAKLFMTHPPTEERIAILRGQE